MTPQRKLHVVVPPAEFPPKRPAAQGVVSRCCAAVLRPLVRWRLPWGADAAELIERTELCSACNKRAEWTIA